MLEQKKNGRGVQVVLTGALCACVVCATILLVGAAGSLGVVRGWIRTEQMQYAALAGMWLGALLGGVFLCVRTKGIPLLCGAVVGGVEVLICLTVGFLTCGAPTGMGVIVRGLTGLAGGILGGILCAMMRTARRRS